MILKIIAISFVMMSSAVNAYNILIVTPLPYKSHWIFMESIVERLLEKGNSLTVISPFKYKYNDYVHESLREIIIPKYKVDDIFPSKDIFNGKYESDISYIQTLYKIGLAVSEHTLSQPNVKELILGKDEFDAVLVDATQLDSLYLFAQKYSCPLIVVDINGQNNHLDEAMGIMTPHSFVPHPVTKYEKEMTYMQRCYNALLYVYEAAVRRFSYLPAQNKLAQKYFQGGISGTVPNVKDMIKKISLILSNSYLITPDRPKMAAQINVAGLHMKDDNLYEDYLEDLLTKAKYSVIYFSLGSYIKSSEMPQEKLHEIIKAFSKIKKTVLWQYEGNVPDGLPDNIIMKKWFPQKDLLSNKKVVLFVTQGGALSYQEAIKNRVPMLIIPFNGEQYRNGIEAERNHFGKMIPFDDITEETFADALTTILEDNTYFMQISKVSSKLSNVPIEPLKNAIFWIHHACKYQDIEKSPSVYFSWFTYYELDVLAFYMGILLTCIMFWVFSITLIVRRYRQREQRGKFKYY